MTQIIIRLDEERTSRERTYTEIIWEDKKYATNHVIKYLHSMTRFETLSFFNLFELIMNSSSIRSTKLMFNSAITRVFAEIVKNDVKTQIYKEKSKAYKILAEKACYMMLLDKKNTTSMNYSKIDSKHIILKANYHFTCIYEFRIAEDVIWFTQDMSSLNSRKKIAFTIAKTHLLWKIVSEKQYIQDCISYVEKRRSWEYEFFLFAKKHHISMNWSTSTDLSLMKNSRLNSLSTDVDYRLIVEKKNQSISVKSKVILKKESLI